LALAEIDDRLKAEEAAYAATMREYLNRELANLQELIAAGKVDIGKLSDPDSGIFRFDVPLRSALSGIVTRVRDFGRQQVENELARQGSATR